jgi:hypothetical protein
LAADYNIARGGLLPFGMLFLLLSPLVAARLRGITFTDRENEYENDKS